MLSPILHLRSTLRFRLLICALWLSGGLLLALVLSFSANEIVRAQGSPGTIEFSESSYSVNETGGSVAIKLRRAGGTDGKVTAKVSLADVTTSSADYVFSPGAVDKSFAQVPEASGSFLYYSKQIALQSDGKVLVVGGSFVRVNPDGSHDSSFNPGTRNGGITSMAVQPDGKIVIAGSFTNIGGATRNGVARLNSDGSLDGTFDVGVGSTDVNVVTLQTDGKVLVGGVFTNFNLGPNTAYIARLNTDGSLDSSFSKGDDPSTVYEIVVQPDNKILLGGLGFIPIIRLNSDGSADHTFACNLAGPVLAIALLPDNKILAGGSFKSAGGQAIPPYVARLNSDGTFDAGFNIGQGPDASVVDIALQPDGKVIVGGDFNLFNGAPMANIARLNPNGSLDNTFNSRIPSTPGAGNFIHSLLFQPDGKIIAGGSFGANGTNFNRQRLARFDGDLIVTWQDGDGADKTINLPIVDDLIDEPDETLSLTLTPLAGGATLGPISSATLTILDNDVPPAFTSSLPPQGITRLNYTHSFTATGTPNPTFSLTSGTLPPGLFLQSSGVLSGSPSAAGTFDNITVSASNGVAPPASQTFSITILSGGTLQLNSSTYSLEENGGSAVITVTRTGGSAGATTVNYNTNGFGSATGGDYIATSGTLNFAEGETSKTFAVQVTDDSLDENNETVGLSINTVNGSGVLGSPTSATLTIVDDDPMPTLSINNVTLTEGNGGLKSAVFSLALSTASGRSIVVNFATANGTATAGSDYQFAAGTITFPAGTTAINLFIAVLGDTTVEKDETFFVNLTNPVNVIVSTGQGTGTILNDDTLKLVIEESGPASNQAAALDAMLLVRDPFHVRSIADWLNLGSDRNTRVAVFVSNLQLYSGDTASAVGINLSDSDNQSYDLTAEDVRLVPIINFVQVVFRLPDGLAAGQCQVKVKAYGQTSNTGTIRIAQ